MVLFILCRNRYRDVTKFWRAMFILKGNAIGFAVFPALASLALIAAAYGSIETYGEHGVA
jgi:hypothetical protein